MSVKKLTQLYIVFSHFLWLFFLNTNIYIFTLKMYVSKICHAIITYKNIHVQIFFNQNHDFNPLNSRVKNPYFLKRSIYLYVFIGRQPLCFSCSISSDWWVNCWNGHRWSCDVCVSSVQTLTSASLTTAAVLTRATTWRSDTNACVRPDFTWATARTVKVSSRPDEPSAWWSVSVCLVSWRRVFVCRRGWVFGRWQMLSDLCEPAGQLQVWL